MNRYKGEQKWRVSRNDLEKEEMTDRDLLELALGPYSIPLIKGDGAKVKCVGKTVFESSSA